MSTSVSPSSGAWWGGLPGLVAMAAIVVLASSEQAHGSAWMRHATEAWLAATVFSGVVLGIRVARARAEGLRLVGPWFGALFLSTLAAAALMAVFFFKRW